METETVGIENLITEIYDSPNNTYSQEELRTKSYIELLEIRDGIYGFHFEAK